MNSFFNKTNSIKKSVHHMIRKTRKNFVIFSKNKEFFAKNVDFTENKELFESVVEPEEFRTLYIENLPHEWDEDDIRLRLEQAGNIHNIHLIKNTLGESLGKVIITYDKIDNSIQSMNLFRNKIPYFNPLKIRFYRKYDFTIKKLLQDLTYLDNNTKKLRFFEPHKKEVLLIKNVPQHLIKDDLKLFISEFKTPIHISYPRDPKDEFKRIAYVYFAKKEDAEFVMKYLHLRWVQNKQLYVSYANNYLDITDFRTRIEQGILIEDKQIEMKYYLKHIGTNMRLIQELKKLADNKLHLDNKKFQFLENDLSEKNKYLIYKYRLLDYENKNNDGYKLRLVENPNNQKLENNIYLNNTDKLIR